MEDNGAAQPADAAPPPKSDPVASAAEGAARPPGSAAAAAAGSCEAGSVDPRQSFDEDSGRQPEGATPLPPNVLLPPVPLLATGAAAAAVAPGLAGGGSTVAIAVATTAPAPAPAAPTQPPGAATESNAGDGETHRAEPVSPGPPMSPPAPPSGPRAAGAGAEAGPASAAAAPPLSTSVRRSPKTRESPARRDISGCPPPAARLARADRTELLCVLLFRTAIATALLLSVRLFALRGPRCTAARPPGPAGARRRSVANLYPTILLPTQRRRGVWCSTAVWSCKRLPIRSPPPRTPIHPEPRRRCRCRPRLCTTPTPPPRPSRRRGLLSTASAARIPVLPPGRQTTTWRRSLRWSRAPTRSSPRLRVATCPMAG